MPFQAAQIREAQEFALYCRSQPRAATPSQRDLLQEFLLHYPASDDVIPPPLWLTHDDIRKQVRSRVLLFIEELSRAPQTLPSRSRTTTSTTTSTSTHRSTRSSTRAPSVSRLAPPRSSQSTSADEEIPRPDLNMASNDGNNNNTGGAAPAFSPEQMAALQRLLADALAAGRRDEGRRGEGAERPPPAPSAPPWRDSEVGFFHPDLDASYGDGDVVTVSSECVFRDIHLFIDRLKDAVAYRNEALVRERIPSLLRGAAQMWFSTGLDHLTKAGLRYIPLDDGWYAVLKKQFQRPLSEALRSLTAMKYTLLDARQRRPVAQFVYSITRHARDAGMTTPQQQLTFAYNGLDVQLRLSIPEPSDDISVADFVRQLESQRENWAGLADSWLRLRYSREAAAPSFRRRYDDAPPPQGQYQQYRQTTTPTWPQQSQSSFAGNPMGQRTNYNQRQLPHANNNAKMSLPPPPQRLAITNGVSTNPRAGSFPPRSYARPTGEVTQRREYTSRSYHVADEHDEEGDIFLSGDEQEADAYLTGTSSNASPEDPATPDTEYYPADDSTALAEEIFSVHAQTPTHICDTCDASFPTGNKLHQHLRDTNHQRRTKNS